MDLREEIAASFGEGPGHRPIEDRLVAGRRVVRRRRRRIAGATAAAAVLVVVGTTFAAAGPGGGNHAETGVATGSGATGVAQVDEPATIPVDPNSCSRLSGEQRQRCEDFPGSDRAVYYTHDGQLVRRDADVRVSKRVDNPVDLDAKSVALEYDEGDGTPTRWLFLSWSSAGNGSEQKGAPGQDAATFDDWVRQLILNAQDITPDSEGDVAAPLAEYDADGNLQLANGVTITQRIENPFGAEAPNESVGLELEKDREKFWYLAHWGPSLGSGWISDRAYKAFPSLQSWIDDLVALQTGGARLQLVKFGTDGRLAPLDGVTIVQQRANPDVGQSFAPAGTPTAVAEVTYQGDTWFVLARDLPDGPPEYFPTAAAVSGSTIDAFLDYARQQYAGGEGLR